MKKRLLFYQIVQHIKHKNAIVVTGMRQVGKTTLMRQVFRYLPAKMAKLWFDFDNPLEMKIFEDIDYRNIYRRLEREADTGNKRLFVFIDEIQNYPEITKIIKYLIDHYQVKFFLTGSSNFYLKNLFPESLSGRKFLYDLPPLSFKEYLYFHNKLTNKEAGNINITAIAKPINIFTFKKFETDYENYLSFGGFPEVVTTNGVAGKQEVLKNIFKSFFEKDLKILSDHKEIRELRDLILLLVPRVGSTLDITKIASELGVDRPKIYNYLEFLQGVYFIRLLPKFSKSIDRSVAGGKKIYFTDNGILNIIGKVNDGQLLENSIVNQLAFYGDLSFYSKRNTAEIDFILDKKIAFETKLTGTRNDLKKLSQLSRNLGIKKQFVISRSFMDEKGFLSSSQI